LASTARDCRAAHSTRRAIRRLPNSSDEQRGGDRDEQSGAEDAVEARWRFTHDGLSRVAGRELPPDSEVYASARLLGSFDRVDWASADATGLYTRQRCWRVSTRNLAAIGATLADGGVNPDARKQVVAPRMCRHLLAVMLTAGRYESSASGFIPSSCRTRAGSVAGSSRCRRATTAWTPLLRRLTWNETSVTGQLVAKCPVPAARSGPADLAAGGTIACGVRVDEIAPRDV
jgi:hypothetical protein